MWGEQHWRLAVRTASLLSLRTATCIRIGCPSQQCSIRRSLSLLLKSFVLTSRILTVCPTRSLLFARAHGLSESFDVSAQYNSSCDKGEYVHGLSYEIDEAGSTTSDDGSFGYALTSIGVLCRSTTLGEKTMRPPYTRLCAHSSTLHHVKHGLRAFIPRVQRSFS